MHPETSYLKEPPSCFFPPQVSDFVVTPARSSEHQRFNATEIVLPPKDRIKQRQVDRRRG